MEKKPTSTDCGEGMRWNAASQSCVPVKEKRSSTSSGQYGGGYVQRKGIGRIFGQYKPAKEKHGTGSVEKHYQEFSKDLSLIHI